MTEFDKLSPEQRDIAKLPLSPIAVTACAGSGKTTTAVYRLAEMRKRHQAAGLIALLSFSNIAVDTFRKEYAGLMRQQAAASRSSAVEIDTMDGFITSNVLRPHGHRVMNCNRVPFLVEGREAFLNSFTVFDGDHGWPTAKIDIACEGEGFRYTKKDYRTVLDENRAQASLAKLGAVGAYTHSAGRYWVLRVLREKPFVLRALARRYPHILVDEAQDVGPEHQAILELLIKAGAQVSLIGDSHQGIYEFANADGSFLKEYGNRPEVTPYQLTVNHRSLPDIVGIANKLTKRADSASRTPATDRTVAYYMPYKASQREHALASFRSLIGAAGLEPSAGVVLCRSSSLTAEWSGHHDGQGIGAVRLFADAAISRDQRKDLHQAFSQTCLAFTVLLDAKHGSLLTKLARPADDLARSLRRQIWTFVRDPATGLPSAHLTADTDWHPLLNTRARALVATLGGQFGLTAADNLGQRLAKKKLEARPLVAASGLAADVGPRFRTSTVHKVKGESLQAVLYVAEKSHVRALLNGTGAEEGRIGYVALTRACDLFVLAVPDNCLGEFETDLIKLGLKRVGLSSGFRPPS